MISKSTYVGFCLCPRAAWLGRHHPEYAAADENMKARAETGTEVGLLARGLFGPFVSVFASDTDGMPDTDRMIRKTEEEMRRGTPVICEAAFAFGECFCAVDILRKEDGGWAIYEVKSTTAPLQSRFFQDAAFQRYVLEKCGVTVTGVYIVSLNSGYVLDGELDIERLFSVTDVSGLIAGESARVGEETENARRVLGQAGEPDTDLHEGCPGCPYWDHCTGTLPKPNVFDLYRMPFTKKLSLYKRGICSFEALRDSPWVKNDRQRRQIAFALSDCGALIDREGIRGFLSTLSYPLAFLDFETMQPAVPVCRGTAPYSQIPFQYSLHLIMHEGEPPEHREYLAGTEPDPRRGLAEALCADIPADACVTAYNKTFECGRLRELAAAFPDLADRLNGIADHIRDLLDPFRDGYYYVRAMGGSFSIKSVLPALYPDDPALDYHRLDGVHNGGEAMSVFPKLKSMSPDDRRIWREALLRYCELDTLAMVRVWEKLKEAASEQPEMPSAKPGP